VRFWGLKIGEVLSKSGIGQFGIQKIGFGTFSGEKRNLTRFSVEEFVLTPRDLKTLS
jgi:hypothetical protein